MTLITQKSFQATKKDVKYLSRDFSQIKQSLMDFAKVYYPNTYKDFNDASVGMMFIEMSAYVGDILSYYIDYQYKESMLTTAEERKSIIDCARTLGYRPKVTTPAATTLDVYHLLPATIDQNGNTVPDLKYGQIIKPYMTVTSDSGVNFFTNASIDFTADTTDDPLEISVYQRSSSGIPELYVVKKSVAASAGQIVSKEVTVGDPQSFYRIELGDTNVIGILDVYDSDGNRWYETDYLANELVPIEIENISKNDSSLSVHRTTVPFLVQYLNTAKRFVTGINSDDSTFLEFGSGTGISDDETISMSVKSIGNTSLNSVIDPANFLNGNSYGQAPANTTLTIRYIIGGGVESNVNANAIKNVSSVEFFGDITELPQGEQDLTNMVRNSIKVNNSVPAIGGRGTETNDEIRNNALANTAAQNRAVTQKDYEVRAYSMPSRFGAVAKAYAIADSKIGTSATSTNPLAVNLYVLGYDANQRLTVTNEALRQNLKTYIDKYRILTDAVNVIDGFIINIGVDFSIVVSKSFNKKDVLTNCIAAVRDYLSIENMQFCQPINLSRLELTIANVSGVQSVSSLTIKNLTTKDGDYSSNEYDISSAIKDRILYPSIDPSVFEVKYPTKDIVGRVL